ARTLAGDARLFAGHPHAAGAALRADAGGRGPRNPATLTAAPGAPAYPRDATTAAAAGRAKPGLAARRRTAGHARVPGRDGRCPGKGDASLFRRLSPRRGHTRKPRVAQRTLGRRSDRRSAIPRRGYTKGRPDTCATPSG